MGLFTSNPTANQTPDATLGGIAVTGISNTGHSFTTASCSSFSPFGGGGDSDSQIKSARWFTFPTIPMRIVGVRLKFTWSMGGNTSISPGGGGGFASAFATARIDYSVNGGGAWTTFVTHTASGNDSFSDSGSADINLGVPTVTSVQVRDLMSASTTATSGSLTDASADADASITISSIRLEITFLDGKVITIM